MIEIILKRANEIASLKKSCGMDVAEWTLEDCLKAACNECFASYEHLPADCYEVRTMAGDVYPVSVHAGKWVTGWI